MNGFSSPSRNFHKKIENYFDFQLRKFSSTFFNFWNSNLVKEIFYQLVQNF